MTEQKSTKNADSKTDLLKEVNASFNLIHNKEGENIYQHPPNSQMGSSRTENSKQDMVLTPSQNSYENVQDIPSTRVMELLKEMD